MGHPEDLLFITPVETIGNWIFPLFHSEEALDKKTSILHKLAKVAKRMALAKPSPSGCLSPLLVRGRAFKHKSARKTLGWMRDGYSRFCFQNQMVPTEKGAHK